MLVKCPVGIFPTISVSPVIENVNPLFCKWSFARVKEYIYYVFICFYVLGAFSELFFSLNILVKEPYLTDNTHLEPFI